MASTLFTGATVIDGTGADARRHAAVLVTDGRIAHVGPASDLQADGAEVVDLGGATLLPALVNAHEHFSMKGFEGKYYDQHRTDAQMQLVRASQGAYRSISEGITTARDCGAHGTINVPLRDAIANGVGRGPRIVTCGQVIQPAMKGIDVRPVGMTREARDAAEVRRHAEALLSEGVDFIKVKAFRSDFETKERRTFTADECRPAIDVAHAAGKKAACHVWYDEDMRVALEAGFDAIEHALYLEATIDLLAEAAKRGVTLVPCWTSWAVSQHGSAERSAHHRTIVQRAVADGVEIAVGTDLYTETMADEIRALAGMGLGPLGAIRAATAVGAKVCGLTDTGAIAAGMRADLMAVAGDPLADPMVLRAPTLVLKDGERLVGAAPRRVAVVQGQRA